MGNLFLNGSDVVDSLCIVIKNSLQNLILLRGAEVLKDNQRSKALRKSEMGLLRGFQIKFPVWRRCNEMEWIKVRLGFDSSLAVDCVGRGGGLALLLNAKADVEILSYSVNHIDAKVRGREGGQEWRYIGFYGEPDRARRHFSWDLMRRRQTLNSLP
ncbi:hypothetical protein PTKIN_Ptkin02bG0096700 [Pterospermum kingtungense]